MSPKTCTVEIFSIGNELLLGNTINTNAAWIAKRVTELGGRVTRVTVVGDILNEIIGTVREALRRAPTYIITTGGIGPTFDDMTVKAIARSLRQPFRLDPQALKMIKDHYAKRFPKKTVKLTQARLKMAKLPIHGIAVSNPVGTAPAVKVETAKTAIFCLPGVPREAKAIFNATIAPEIHQTAGERRFLERWLRVAGIMESTLAPIVEQTMKRWPAVYIKSHPRRFKKAAPIIELHLSVLSATRETETEVTRAANFLAKKLERMKGRVVFLG